MSLLQIDNISVHYGQLAALRGVSISMNEGETLFITGPNGAGKSTLLKAIAGAVKPTSGQITFSQKKISGQAPEQIARMGFSMVPEGRHVFGSLTIEENLRLGTGMRQDRDKVEEDIAAVYTVFPMLAERRTGQAGVLSGGQQQMLVIGRALMAGPKLIAIDEPSLGLAPKIIDQVYETLAELRDSRGLTLLIVEQSATRAMLMGGRMVLMRNGQVVLEGDAGKLANDEALRQAYFGFGKN